MINLLFTIPPLVKMDWVSEQLMKGILDWLFSQLSDCLKWVTVLFTTTAIDLFNNEYISNLLIAFQVFGFALLGVSIFLAYMETAINIEQDGGSYITASINSIKGFAAFIGFVKIPQDCFVYTGILANNLISSLSFSAYTTSSENIESALKETSDVICTVLNADASNIGLMLLIYIFFVYVIVKITLGSIKRSGILIIQLCVGTFHVFGIPRGYMDGFSSWCKQIVALCLTQFLQTILFVIGLGIIKDVWLGGLGLILAATEVPRIAQQFGLDTSIRVNMTSAAMAASSVARMKKG